VTQPSHKHVDVVLFGLGALGSRVIDCLRADHPLISIVGAVDRDPAKAGKTLGALYPGLTNGANVVIVPSLRACLDGLKVAPTVIYHMTESEPAHIEEQLTEALSAGANVISGSEAMFHPGLRHAAFTARIDATARNAGVSITGVGINPGFSFDALPLMLARVTSDVSAVHISRCIDVTGTGPGDIDHVGYGLTPDDFHKKIASGRIVGHMGMPDSIAAVAERLNMDIDAIDERWETSTATFPVDSGVPALGMIEPGRVIGITQTGRGLKGGEPVITMSLIMYYQPEMHGLEIVDEIEIVGAHHVRAALKPAAISIFGAANAIVSTTHDLVAAEPGLVSMLDFSIAGVQRGGFRYVVDETRGARPGYVALQRAPI